MNKFFIKLRDFIRGIIDVVIELNDSINLANKLTILRIFLVPLFVIFISIDNIPHNITIALLIFIGASITDYFDGYIARTRMMITEFGKFLDPIADKIIVMSALVCFTGKGWIQPWVVVVILARDFIISAIRLAAVQSEEKLVIPARTSGKVKTAITMITICFIMGLWLLNSYGLVKFEVEIQGTTTVLNRPDLLLAPIGNALMYICVALNVFSGVQYVWDARDILKDVFKK
ncbi:MAG: CDP-diacylglycerol--glycerol-3-phosphate 3-phosphatidyltransferase [Oscillospiraceae bacterium]|nr:CDP-diacylglycerol--glycerol-3-phosphate 3-phosphatidyltransferase [Oscillospiraceae bacterium]